MFHAVGDNQALAEILFKLIRMFAHDVSLFGSPVGYLSDLKGCCLEDGAFTMIELYF